MKINEIKQEIVVRTEYIADDGTKFCDQEQCKQYENTCKYVIMAQYKNLVKKHMTFYELMQDTGLWATDEESVDIIEIKNENDVYTINKVIAYYHGALIDNSIIGSTIMMFINYDGECLGDYITIDEFLAKIKENYDT